MGYTIDGETSGPFDETVEETIKALDSEGFGVLCDIDVEETFAKKLDEDFRQYRILGACNPDLAYDALEKELLLGTLLPCNVIVYETDDGTVGVSAVDPGQLIATTGNDELQGIAKEVQQRFETIMNEVTG